MKMATSVRRLQFRSGPQSYEFFACAEHRPKLEKGDVSCFFATEEEPVHDVNEQDEQSCYFCREGGGDLL